MDGISHHELCIAAVHGDCIWGTLRINEMRQKFSRAAKPELLARLYAYVASTAQPLECTHSFAVVIAFPASGKVTGSHSVALTCRHLREGERREA
jgi:hypothetical protein